MGETISEAIFYLAERKKLFFYYIWDVDQHYRRGRDGLNFGPGEQQLPREDGTLDHRVLLRTLKQVGYEGVASLSFFKPPYPNDGLSPNSAQFAPAFSLSSPERVSS